MKSTQEILKKLDDVYGWEKDGFYHNEPWQLLIAIMLSAQSTDAQVDKVLPELFDHYKKAEDMAKADLKEIEQLIRTIGIYKNKAKNMKECCRQVVEEFEGQVPDTREKLMRLAGVGRKTANLYLSDQHGIPGITVDTHVNRISNRLGWVFDKDPLKVEAALEKVLPKDHWIRINIQLIRHGRAVCKARNPLCQQCDFSSWCKYLKKDK